MRKQKIQDERVLAQNRKIGNDAFQILFYGLILSVLIQQYMFNAPFSQYAVEVIMFITVSLYVVVRNIIVGNDIFSTTKNRQKLVIINSLVCGFTVTIINTTLNYIKFNNLFKKDIGNTILVSLITFLCATIVSFVVFQFIFIMNKKKQLQIEERMKDDDE